MIREFEKLKKHTMRSVKKGAEVSLDMVFKKLKKRNEQLKQEQLEIESETSEDFEELVTHFEIRFDNIRSKLVNKYQEFFRELESLENTHSEALVSRTASLIEKHMKKEKNQTEGAESKKKNDGTDSPDNKTSDSKESKNENIEILLKDKESLMTSIVTSNDIHIGKLLGVEDEMRERLSKKTKERVERIHEAERERNRGRVLDINHFYQNTLKEIEIMSSEYIVSE